MFRPTTTKTVVPAIIMVAVFISGASAFAQDSQRADRFMREFDENRDGVVSRNEYPGPDDAFQRLDGNRDGAINSAEVMNSLRRKGTSGGNFIDKFDADKDGKVSKQEFPRSDEQFARLDANGDGYITEDEAPSGRGRGGHESRGGGRPPMN